MRGCFRYLHVLGALLWAAGLTASETEQIPPVSVEMPLKQITEDIYYVQGLPGIATGFEGFVSGWAVDAIDIREVDPTREGIDK